MSMSYLLSSGRPELDRLRLQALVWEPDAEALFGEIPVRAGWTCVDVGCGAAGVLRPLSHAVGPSGSVVGLELDPLLASAAEEFAADNSLSNVAIRRGDIFAGDLTESGFDLVHVRFMFAPIGRDEELLARCAALCRPGGVLVIEEPDASSWTLLPADAAFDRLKAIIRRAFAAGGGDFDAGRRTRAMLQQAGFAQVQIRAAIHALGPGHPYLRLPIQFATSLRSRISASAAIAESALDDLVAQVDRSVAASDAAGLTFALIQAWGRKEPSGR